MQYNHGDHFSPMATNLREEPIQTIRGAHSPPPAEFFSPASDRWLVKWSLIFLFWTVLGVINVSQIYVEMTDKGMVHSYFLILVTELVGCWFVYFLFTPVILWLGKTFPLERAWWKTSVPVHVLAFLILSSLHSITVNASSRFFQPYGQPAKNRQFWEGFWSRYKFEFHLELMFYVMILGFGYSVSYYRRFREREYRATQLESQLVTAQLEVLKMQLQPHFLFNTINGIVGLVRDQKNDAAVNMLVGLSDLLRHTLQNAQKQTASLRDELEFLELYLDLQQMRFPDRLQVKMNIAPETLAASVPNMMLQPLVENSIRHGIAKRVDVGVLEITAAVSGVSGRELVIKIHDNGAGLPENWSLENCEGIGLANTRERLRQLYDGRYSFVVENAEGGGVDAVITIPFEIEAA
jgi:two-component system, LytTR family, sensor kinase